jgi:hypothetical protein
MNIRTINAPSAGAPETGTDPNVMGCRPAGSGYESDIGRPAAPLATAPFVSPPSSFDNRAPGHDLQPV